MGPNISLTFPGYFMINPNVEEQYREWRLERMAAVPPQDYMDMDAFRQHLKGIGAPDPGVPSTAGGGKTAGPSAIPPAGPSAAPPTAPKPGEIPGAPGKDYKPGTVFAPKPRTGTAADLIAGGLDIGGTAPSDIPYYFPFLEGEEEGNFAARNLLRGLGMNMDVGNPYNAYLQGRIPGMSETFTAQDLLGGGAVETLRERLPGGVAGALKQGGGGPGLGMIGNIANLQDKYAASPESLSEGERILAQRYMDPNEALDLYQEASNLPSALRRAQSRSGATMQERYRNLAPGLGNKTFMRFLYGG